MISLNEIADVFDGLLCKITTKETLYNYRLEIKSNCPFNMLNEILTLLGNIPNRDEWQIRIIYSYDVNHSFSKGDNPVALNDFIKKNNAIFLDEPIEIEIEVKKSFDKDELSIYDFRQIETFLLKKSYSDFLEFFCEFREQQHKFLYFRCLNDDVFFETNYFCFFTKENEFSHSKSNLDREALLNKRDQICNINWKRYISLTPTDFEIQNRKGINDSIIKYLDTVKVFLSIMYLVDNSILENNLLKINIYGYRMIESEIDLCKECLIIDEFYKIFKWLYFDGNIFDKVQIARNILTLHCRYIEILKIDHTVLESIRSNYKLYLKDNVDRYIEVSNQVSLFLNQIYDKISDLSDSFVAKFKNNFFAFLTFFFTTMVMNTITNGKIENIFTKDIAYLTYAFLVISLGYLIMTRNEYKKSKDRLLKNYERNKNYYKELLDEKDVERLYGNNNNINEDITYMDSTIKKNTIFWLLTIIVLFITVSLLK